MKTQKKGKKRCSVCGVRCTPAMRIAGTCRYCRGLYCPKHIEAYGRENARGHCCDAIAKKAKADLKELHQLNPGGGKFEKIQAI